MIEEICRANRTLILKRTKNRVSDIILNHPQPHAYPQTDKKQHERLDFKSPATTRLSLNEQKRRMFQKNYNFVTTL